MKVILVNGCPTSLSKLEIGDELLAMYAKDTLKIVNNGKGMSGRLLMSEADNIEVLKSGL